MLFYIRRSMIDENIKYVILYLKINDRSPWKYRIFYIRRSMIDLHENIEYFILEDQWEVKIKRQNLSISLIYLNGV